MERAVKEENIGALKADLAKATSLVLADFRGIAVRTTRPCAASSAATAASTRS